MAGKKKKKTPLGTRRPKAQEHLIGTVYGEKD